MALDSAPALVIQRKVAFALEATNGTLPSITTADAVTPVFTESNIEVIAPDIETVERESQGTSSPEIAQVGACGADVNFETEFFNSGSGTAPIWLSRLFVASGFVAGSGGVYSPITGNTVTLSVVHYLPTEARYSQGTMFNWTLTAERGKPARMKWTGKGIWNQPDSGTLAAPSYLTVRAPRVGATTFTIGGVTYRTPKIEITPGNTLYLREDITALDSDSSATGYRSCCITKRDPRWRVSIEAKDIGTIDWNDFFRAGTTAVGSLVIGSGSNNVLTWAAPKLALAAPPKISNRNGLVVHDLEFKPTRNSAGDDEQTLTIS